MAIVDDYVAIAAELRRVQAEKAPPPETRTDEQWKLATSHRMWRSEAGEQLYRWLVMRNAVLALRRRTPV